MGVAAVVGSSLTRLCRRMLWGRGYLFARAVLARAAAGLAVGVNTKVEHGPRRQRSPAGLGDVRVDQAERRDRAERDLAVKVRVVLVERAPREGGGASFGLIHGEVARQDHRSAVAVGDRRAREGRVVDFGLDTAAKEEGAAA